MALKSKDKDTAYSPSSSEKSQYVRGILEETSDEQLLHDKAHGDLCAAHVCHEQDTRDICSLSLSTTRSNTDRIVAYLLIYDLSAGCQVCQLLARCTSPLYRYGQRLTEAE